MIYAFIVDYITFRRDKSIYNHSLPLLKGVGLEKLMQKNTLVEPRETYAKEYLVVEPREACAKEYLVFEPKETWLKEHLVLSLERFVERILG